MKNYIITYKGASFKHRNLRYEIVAESKREAVETWYAKFMDDDYFPEDVSSEDCVPMFSQIRDGDGRIVATPFDETIDFDGGRFGAKELFHVIRSHSSEGVEYWGEPFSGFSKAELHLWKCEEWATDNEFDIDFELVEMDEDEVNNIEQFNQLFNA